MTDADEEYENRELLSIIGRSVRLTLVGAALFVILTANRLTAWDNNTGSKTYYGALLPLFDLREWDVVFICLIILAILCFVETFVLVIQAHDYREFHKSLHKREESKDAA